jgi:8-oxo-dGTP diphosphatase
MKYPRVGIGVLIFNQKNEVLLGKRLNSHGEGCWGPSGGHLEFDETFEEAAIREVYEETGLHISNPKFFALTNDNFSLEEKHYISIFMKAEYPPEQAVQNREPDKTIEWQWFSFTDLPSPLFLPLQNLQAGKGYAVNP